jgi:hypothetical protein
MVEYHVLIPGSILLVIVVAGLLGPYLGNAFRRVLRPMMDQKACVASYDINDNSICSENGNCEKVENETMDSGSFTFKDAMFVESVVIKAGQSYNIYRADSGKFETTTDDGCYHVSFSGNIVEWARIGGGPSCKAISHIDVWQAPICQ